jgi:DNA-binding transcriptional LysR family regulator
MDFPLIASFVAVAEELHFSRAAQRRNISQPALSKQIRQLESLLALQLFERDRRSVRLTPEGTALLSRAQAVVAGVAGIEEFAGQLRRGTAGRIRVGFTPSAPHHVLPALLRHFRRRYPAIEPELVEMSSGDQLGSIERGALDIGLLRPPRRPPPTLVCHEVLREPFVAAIPEALALARRRRISLVALGRVPLVLVARRAAPDVYDDLLAAFQRAGVHASVQREATQINTALALVMAGVGVALVPRSASRVRLDGVTFRPITQPLFTAFVVAHLKTSSPLVTAFAGVASAADLEDVE